MPLSTTHPILLIDPIRVRIGLVILSVLSFAFSGCGRYETFGFETPDDTEGSITEDHLHNGGLGGGTLTSLGNDEYHAEAFVSDKDNSLTVYLYGSDETVLLQVSDQILTAYVKVQGTAISAAIVLRPAPMDGDASGKTSRFKGELPDQLVEQALSITIPGLRIGEARFAARFLMQPSSLPTMPSAVASDEASDLYLTAAGKYSNADIAANGNTTAAEKFRGFRPNHDPNPQPGDLICPITKTKANPECSWIIGGETYYFCCPPCIDEFLAQQKELAE